MKTEELIRMLSTGSDAIDPHLFKRRYIVAMTWGVAGAVVLMLVFMGLRPDLWSAARSPMFWVKLLFPTLIIASAFLITTRLSRPGVRLGNAPFGLVAPVLVIWGLAAMMLFNETPGERIRLIFGQTWAVCPISIAMLSVPAFIATFWAMKGLAPTRPVLAGAASGLLAGAVGAFVYAFHCPEESAPFAASWYLLGMLVPAMVGGILGFRLLRW